MALSKSTAVFLLLLSSVGCRTAIPKEALQWNEQSMERRHLQTRYFQTSEEGKLLSACSGLLQDLGFSIDETESKLGLIVASKQRTAVDTGQVIGATLLSILSGKAVPFDKTQKMRACIVTRPFADGIAVRVTFQRIVWNSEGKVSHLEGLFDPKLFQEFFAKLSKAIFLEAHEI